IPPVRWNPIAVVGPTVWVQRRVLDIPDCRAAELIGSRTGLNLDSAIAAPEFRVHRGDNQSDFSDQIRIDDRSGVDARRPPHVLNHNAVSQYGTVLRTYARKRGTLAAECVLSRTARRNEIVEATQHCEHVEHVIANDGQITNL